MNSIAIHIEGVSKRFQPGMANEIVALDDIRLDVLAGEWTYIVGGNACGKTTMLRAIFGQYEVDSGEIKFPSSPDTPSLFLVESAGQIDLIPSMTVYENLLLTNPTGGRFPSLRRYMNTLNRKRFEEVLSKFQLGLEHRLNDQVAGMSGGQQQAIVAAKVLLCGASIVLLDEFTSALDKKTAPIILQTLREYATKNAVTIVAVTHDYHWISDTADRVVVMENGAIKEVLRKSSLAAMSFRTDSTAPTEYAFDKLTAELIMERLYGSE